MLDNAYIRSHPEDVENSLRRRGEDPTLVSAFLEADASWRALNISVDELRNERKTLSAKVAALRADPAAQAVPRAEAVALGQRLALLEQELTEVALTREALAKAIPNIVAPNVPDGGEENFLVLDTFGDTTLPTFPVKDHVELGVGLGLLDLERGARTSGSRFYYLLGDGTRLERAIASLAHDLADEAGFTPVAAPVLVRPEAMDGTGFLGAHSDEIYHLEADDLYLVGTSEVPLAALHMGETIDGPRRYVSTTSCFRREAGAHGRDTRGIFRVHQFQKTEMFVFCPPNEAEAEHERLVAMERRYLDALELPYRVIDVAAGDLGSSAARKVDIEAWVPSQGRYREVTSSSNCTTFQARRLKIRMRDGSNPPEVAATLNGTLAAASRLIVALLENHQQEDGTVRIPEALRPYMGGRATLG
jgi:seryl-tRNA synthetase